MQKKKIWWIIGLLFLLYCSASGNYLNSGDDYLYDNSSWLALIDLVICSVAMMIVPFIWRIINKRRFELQKGKKICKWNSIIIFIISIIMTASGGVSIIGGLGAVMYYFINKWLFVDEEGITKEHLVEGYECNNCGHIIPNEMKSCPNCHWIQEKNEETDDKYEEDDEEIAAENEELQSDDLYEKAVDLYQTGKYELATEKFEQYVKEITKLKKESDDEEWYTFNNCVEFILYAQNNKTDKKIMDMNYKCNTAYYFMAMIDFENKNYEEAIKKLNKALKWNPYDIKVLFEKAENYKVMGDLKKYYTSTLDLFDKIYSMEDLARYYRNLGYYFIEEKQWDLAKAMYLYSVRFENNPVALQELKYILAKSNNETLPAKEDLKDILKENRIPTFIDKNVIKSINSIQEKIINEHDEKTAVGKFIIKLKDKIDEHI